MSTADRYAALVAAKRPLANDRVLADTCTVQVATAGTKDSRGNVPMTETAGATVRCRLRSDVRLPQERAVADRVQSVAPYAIDLPFGTSVNATDRVAIGARTFDVIGISEAEAFGMFTTVIAEERR